MELWQKQALFCSNVSRLITFIESDNHFCTIGEAWRTLEQAIIYAKNGKGIVDSLHCRRLAIDLNLFTADGKYLSDTADYKKYGDYWKTLHPNNNWGGCFKTRLDGNHFEMHE
jgi:hypothetical protein